MKTNDLNDFSWDKSQIDIGDIYDMEYWSTLWGISKQKIMEAVKQTGSNEVRVIEELLCRNSQIVK
jgi:hypothetical protein